MTYNDTQNLLFLSYIEQYYNSPLLNKLIEKVKYGQSQRINKKIKDKVSEINEVDNIEAVLFYFIVYTRVREESTLNELGWEVHSNLNIEEIDFKEIRKETQALLNKLGMPELKADGQVVKNTIYYNL